MVSNSAPYFVCDISADEEIMTKNGIKIWLFRDFLYIDYAEIYNYNSII